MARILPVLVCGLALLASSVRALDEEDPIGAGCAATLCVAGSLCVEDEDGIASCVPGNSDGGDDPNLCLTTKCPGGTVCIYQDGATTCIDEDIVTTGVPDPIDDACAAVTCEENHACETNETGEPECVSVETITACNLFCVIGKVCKVKNGKPTCVPDKEYNPCAATTCPVGHNCVAEGDKGICISSCAAVRCGFGTQCVLTKKGAAKCVKKKLRCKRKCKKGFKCGAKYGKARCVSNCYGVKCPKRKPRCIVSKKGKAVCVRRKPRSFM